MFFNVLTVITGRCLYISYVKYYLTTIGLKYFNIPLVKYRNVYYKIIISRQILVFRVSKQQSWQEDFNEDTWNILTYTIFKEQSLKVLALPLV
jgi:hypothetical protein